MIFLCMKRPYDQNSIVIYKRKNSKLIISKEIDPMAHGHILRMLMVVIITVICQKRTKLTIVKVKTKFTRATWLVIFQKHHAIIA